MLGCCRRTGEAAAAAAESDTRIQHAEGQIASLQGQLQEAEDKLQTASEQTAMLEGQAQELSQRLQQAQALLDEQTRVASGAIANMQALPPLVLAKETCCWRVPDGRLHS